MPCTMRPAMLLFSSHRAPVCVIHKREFIMHSTIRWLTLKQSMFFCKDNRLVLIVECLFAKASTANDRAWALEAPPSSGAPAHLH